MAYVGRGGEKMAWALAWAAIDPKGWITADLGSNVGGFVDALVTAGAARVYAVDTSYGTFAWKLRNDPRVVVMERVNAIHVTLPEPVRLVTSDVGWTKQSLVLPNARRLLSPDGMILTLVKPQYEATREEIEPGKGRVKDSAIERILADAKTLALGLGFTVQGPSQTPFLGGKGKNPEFFMLLSNPPTPLSPVATP